MHDAAHFSNWKFEFSSKHFFLFLSVFCSISLTPEEGNGSVELLPGGRDIQVNETNVYDYVRMYAYYRMVKTQEKALEVSKFDYYDIRYIRFFHTLIIFSQFFSFRGHA